MLSRSLSRTSALARATPAFAHYPVRGSSRELRDRTSFSLPRASALARKAPNFAALAVCGANFFCSSTEVQDRISQLVKQDKLVLFMKGVPEQPLCGFSSAVVQILAMEGFTWAWRVAACAFILPWKSSSGLLILPGVKSYTSYNVLEDEDLRTGIKKYSNWPTIPQLYVDGEFVGGCDIVMSMYKNDELRPLLQKAGVEVVGPTEEAAEEGKK